MDFTENEVKEGTTSSPTQKNYLNYDDMNKQKEKSTKVISII